MSSPLPYMPVAPGPSLEHQAPTPHGLHVPHHGGLSEPVPLRPRLRLVEKGQPCVKVAQYGKAPSGTCWAEEDLPEIPFAVGDSEDAAIVATSALAITLYALHVAGTAVGAYHGWKRNESVGWTIGWALLGGLAPYIVIPVAFAQGISKKKGT